MIYSFILCQPPTVSNRNYELIQLLIKKKLQQFEIARKKNSQFKIYYQKKSLWMNVHVVLRPVNELDFTHNPAHLNGYGYQF